MAIPVVWLQELKCYPLVFVRRYFVNLNVLLESNFRFVHLVAVWIRVFSTVIGFSGSLKPEVGVACCVGECRFRNVEVQRWVIFCWQKVGRFCLKKVLALDTISSRQSEKITYPSTLLCRWCHSINRYPFRNLFCSRSFFSRIQIY